jgi:phosphoribosylformimino-5-aminoimidazole carboxamide ribotide isomerase
VGTETLTGPDALDRLLAALPVGAVVLSVDLRDGTALSPHPQLAGLPALDAVARLHRAGLREAIVLDLARVGSRAGPDVRLIAELHAAFPDLELLAGGGVRDVEDLRALGEAGAAGALVATALHLGVIGRRELDELR